MGFNITVDDKESYYFLPVSIITVFLRFQRNYRMTEDSDLNTGLRVLHCQLIVILTGICIWC